MHGIVLGNEGRRNVQEAEQDGVANVEGHGFGAVHSILKPGTVF